jgi:hypothetical protein
MSISSSIRKLGSSGARCTNHNNNHTKILKQQERYACVIIIYVEHDNLIKTDLFSFASIAKQNARCADETMARRRHASAGNGQRSDRPLLPTK